MSADLLSLSWKIQVALASGYAAYIIAYRGIRHYHSAQDVLFLSLVFSLIASAQLWWAKNTLPVIAGSSAFLISISASILWRRRGMSLLTAMLRNPNTTWSDDTPSAWARLQENREFSLSQLSVLLKDGTWLYCNRTATFNDWPYAPAVLGTSGDILMYLTSVKVKGEAERDQTTTLDPKFGARITYIPAAEVARVNVRLMPSINLHQKAAASPPKPSTAGLLVEYLRRPRSGLASALRKAAEGISPKSESISAEPKTHPTDQAT